MATHAELFRAAYACGVTKKERLNVQYKKQGMGICAEVVECFDNHVQEWVKLWNSLDGYFSRPACAIEICQGHADGMCTCAPTGAKISAVLPQVHFSRAGVVAPHESPNFRTPAIPQGA